MNKTVVLNRFSTYEYYMKANMKLGVECTILLTINLMHSMATEVLKRKLLSLLSRLRAL